MQVYFSQISMAFLKDLSYLVPINEEQEKGHKAMSTLDKSDHIVSNIKNLPAILVSIM